MHGIDMLDDAISCVLALSSLLGISLRQYLEQQSLLASANGTKPKAKAQACILLWLEGGPSHVDTWDPKSNSNFKPISTNVPGIQISELLPRVAKQMDKLSIIRSMHTEEDNHPQGTYYALLAIALIRRCSSPASVQSSAKKWGRETDSS